MSDGFIPAKPNRMIIAAAQQLIRAELAASNRLTLDKDALKILNTIPAGSGIVLASNHADETDPLVCLELSRLSGIRFLTMCNREAFDEDFKAAGWLLQRLGYFSVKRGAHDSAAKDYAIDVVRGGKQALLIFPEGEIFYLNEEVQTLHSGAIEISLQAILEARKSNPDWTAFLYPMSIQYTYEPAAVHELARRIRRMERTVGLPDLAPNSLQSADLTQLRDRCVAIQTELLDREAKARAVNLESMKAQRMTTQVISVEKKLIDEIAEKYPSLKISPRGQLIDQAWQLAAEITDLMKGEKDHSKRSNMHKDLFLLRRAEQLSSWRPHYYTVNTTLNKLVEVVLKLERHIFNIKRPHQIARRNVHVKFGTPIDVSAYLDDYKKDKHAVHYAVTQLLHDRIQGLLDSTL